MTPAVSRRAAPATRDRAHRAARRRDRGGARDPRPHVLRDRGVAPEDAVALHRRARVEPALARDREHRPRRAPRRAALVRVALLVPDRAGLVDPLDRDRLRGDQVPQRGRDVPHRRAGLPARTDARLAQAARSSVALLSIAIPAMAYATSIVPESLAYPWFALDGAVRRPAARRTEPSVARCRRCSSPSAGLWVRSEFVALPASLVLAAAIALGRRRGPSRGIPWRRIALAGGGARRLRGPLQPARRRSTSRAGRSASTSTTTRFAQGGLAAGALAIGLGFLPVIGGIASLWLPERARDPAYRAFAAYLGASIVTLWVYTAAKSTYLVANLQPADRGAEPLLPLAAAPARDGARARCRAR